MIQCNVECKQNSVNVSKRKQIEYFSLSLCACVVNMKFVSIERAKRGQMVSITTNALLFFHIDMRNIECILNEWFAVVQLYHNYSKHHKNYICNRIMYERKHFMHTADVRKGKISKCR